MTQDVKITCGEGGYFYKKNTGIYSTPPPYNSPIKCISEILS